MSIILYRHYCATHKTVYGCNFLYSRRIIIIIIRWCYMGNANPRTEIPVRRPHADANRPGRQPRAQWSGKTHQPFLGIFFFLYYFTNVLGARGPLLWRWCVGGPRGRGRQRGLFNSYTLYMYIYICYIYYYIGTLNTMSLAVRICILRVYTIQA